MLDFHDELVNDVAGAAVPTADDRGQGQRSDVHIVQIYA